MKAGSRFIAVGCVAALLMVLFLSGCEKSAWSKAQKANTAESYKAFLDKYPNGKFATEAASALETIEWADAEKANTLEAYKSFLDKRPDSKFADTAQQKIAALEAALKEQRLLALEKEAIDNLTAIYAAEESYKAKQQAAKKKVLYLACKPSPAEGGSDLTADSWVDAGGFSQLGFKPEVPVLYQYAVVVDKAGKSYKATATGDLDEDGTKAVFTITSDNPVPVKSPEDEH